MLVDSMAFRYRWNKDMAEIVLNSAGRVVNIALQIKEAVRTVHQNKDECRKVARCVEINSGILHMLAKETEVMCRALKDVKITFEDALKLVKKCQNRHIFCLYFSAKDMANDFNLVMRDIGLKMHQASLCGIVQGAIVSTRIHYAVTTAPPPLSLPEEGTEAGFRRFSLSMLEEATNNFSDENKIGEGGFSSVYRGKLSDWQDVAIKKFRQPLAHGDIMYHDEFIVGTKLRHRNVVSLLGYCIDVRAGFREYNGTHVEVEERTYFLVQRYVPCGSLEDIIAGTRRQRIDWSSCFKILKEIAQGVQYIHEQGVIHLDLKPSNVLLDWDMTPVIIDFGLSKVLKHNEDKIILEYITGTLGHMAPEQSSDRVVTLKSDVFSFGITLLSTIISKHAIKKYNATSSESGSCNGQEHYERMLEEARGLKGLVNRAVRVQEFQLTEVNRCVEVGLLCTESYPGNRPSMMDVVDMLSGKKNLPTPEKQERVFNPVSRKQMVLDMITKNLERAFT